jgi:hypothetical protein
MAAIGASWRIGCSMLPRIVAIMAQGGDRYLDPEKRARRPYLGPSQADRRISLYRLAANEERQAPTGAAFGPSGRRIQSLSRKAPPMRSHQSHPFLSRRAEASFTHSAMPSAKGSFPICAGTTSDIRASRACSSSPTSRKMKSWRLADICLRPCSPGTLISVPIGWGRDYQAGRRIFHSPKPARAYDA